MSATNPFLIFTDRLNQPPEYVIARKLEYYAEGGSEKHLRDIEGILAVSAAAIDQVALERNIDLLGARAAWAKVRRPPQ